MRIKYKKQFIKAMIILVETIIAVITIAIIFANLKISGMSVFFTQPGLKEAFELTESDVKAFNIIETALIIMAFYIGYLNLKDNAELCQIEREEKALCGYSF